MTQMRNIVTFGEESGKGVEALRKWVKFLGKWCFKIWNNLEAQEKVWQVILFLLTVGFGCVWEVLGRIWYGTFFLFTCVRINWTKDSLVWVWFSGPRCKCHAIDVRQIYSYPVLLFRIFLKDTSTLKLIWKWGGIDERTLIGGDVSLI